MFYDFFPFFSAEIVQNKGLEHITVDDLVAEITPKGRGEFVCVYLLNSQCPNFLPLFQYYGDLVE